MSILKAFLFDFRKDRMSASVLICIISFIFQIMSIIGSRYVITLILENDLLICVYIQGL